LDAKTNTVFTNKRHNAPLYYYYYYYTYLYVVVYPRPIFCFMCVIIIIIIIFRAHRIRSCRQLKRLCMYQHTFPLPTLHHPYREYNLISKAFPTDLRYIRDISSLVCAYIQPETSATASSKAHLCSIHQQHCLLRNLCIIYLSMNNNTRHPNNNYYIRIFGRT